MANNEAFEQAWQHWRALRHEELSAPDSWLGLAGLFWLMPGVNRVGSADDCSVHLPIGPAHLGDLLWQNDAVFWQLPDGTVRELETDRLGQPATVNYENLAFFIVDRENQLAVRLRDRAWATTKPFAGLDYFDFVPDWCIEAEWQALSPLRQMELPNVSGELKMVEVSHQAVFELAGESIALLPVSVSQQEVFFVFRDQTSGKESYGAGRFLKAKPAVNGKISLDFNYAFNPPCAFTSYATCPLPPPENWLACPISAGEKKWQGTH